MRNSNNFKIGDIVKHFKYETLSSKEQSDKKYIYKIMHFAIHSETKEAMVVYQSLFNNEIYVRPRDMFESEVDKNKYPQIKQKYRFEIINGISI